MAAFVTYEDIKAWQQGRALVTNVYHATSRPPFSMDHGLRDQMCRAAVSICSNIAEGFERQGNREFVKFLWIAKGSAAEVSSQLYHARDLAYISEEEFHDLYAQAKSIGGMIFNLIKSILHSSSKGASFVKL